MDPLAPVAATSIFRILSLLKSVLNQNKRKNGRLSLTAKKTISFIGWFSVD
jgi:hypothetical protein